MGTLELPAFLGLHLSCVCPIPGHNSEMVPEEVEVNTCYGLHELHPSEGPCEEKTRSPARLCGCGLSHGTSRNAGFIVPKTRFLVLASLTRGY